MRLQQFTALTLRDMPGRVVALSKRATSWSTAMVRSEGKRDGAIRQIPGAREKGDVCPYRDLTQVPLAEKAKACRY